MTYDWPPPFYMRRSDGTKIIDSNENYRDYLSYFTSGAIPGFEIEYFTDPNRERAFASCAGLTGATGTACRKVQSTGKPLPRKKIISPPDVRKYNLTKTPSGIKQLKRETEAQKKKLREQSIQMRKKAIEEARKKAEEKKRLLAEQSKVGGTLGVGGAAVQQGIGQAGIIPPGPGIPIVNGIISTVAIVSTALINKTPVDTRLISQVWAQEAKNIGDYVRDFTSKGAKVYPKGVSGLRLPSATVAPSVFPAIPILWGAEKNKVYYVRSYY